MKKPHVPTIDTLRISEARRQAILDVLNSAGVPMSTPAILAAMEASGVAVLYPVYKGTLSSMLVMGELSSQGRRGKMLFSAMVEVTKSAEVVSQAQKMSQAIRRKNQALEKSSPKHIAARRKTPGVYVHQCGDRDPDCDPKLVNKPLQNQQGQGSARRDVFISYGQLY